MSESGPSSDHQAVAAAGAARSPRLGGSSRVALGVMTSRLFGLVRESLVAAVFGAGGHADVLSVVFRGPMLLQNLLGSQALSAAFVPIYCRLLDSDRREAAGRFAGAVFALLLAVAAAAALAGIFFAETIVAITAPGFLADAEQVAAGAAPLDRYRLAVPAVRLLFPMGGVLLLSAWSLGVLNSHRRFFLPFVAPVLWNTAILSALLGTLLLTVPGGFGALEAAGADGWRDRLLLATCVGALVGGLLQFLVQLPAVAKVMRGFRLSLSTRVEGVRESLRAFGPVLASRGAMQFSSYLDQVLGSLLAAGALASLRWASLLYLLPLSLFSISVAAAELPEISRAVASGADPAPRARRALSQIAFPALPAMVGYLALGYFAVGLVFGRGAFETVDQWLVYLVLGGYTLGLLPTAWSRLLQSVLYGLHDTRTPARIAILRMVLSAITGVALMFWLDRFAVADVVGWVPGERQLYLGGVGLSTAAGVSSWLEFAMLRRALRRRLPTLELPFGRAARMVGLSLAALTPAIAVAWLGSGWPASPRAAAVLAVFAIVYLVAARGLGWPELEAWLGKLGQNRGDR